MTYNIHPLFVHFPIAFLVVYSVLRILPLERWFPNIAWKEIRLALLSFGVLGAFAALLTGEATEHLARRNHMLVETHAAFATASAWIYGILLAGELCAMLQRTSYFAKLPSVVERLVGFAGRTLTKPVIAIVLSLMGLCAITITGVLGGVLVYGTTADPLAPIVLRILGISL